MIKLFRNIRKTLLNEGKTSKYLKYALGEIVLVVIGILIALQISNWNEQKKIEKSIADHLVIFKQNLEEDRPQLEGLREAMAENADYVALAMQQIRTEIPMDKNLKMYLNKLFLENQFRPNKNAIETITQSNEIPYLSQKMQTAILDHYALVESANERENISNRQIQTSYEPYIVMNYPIVFQKDNPWDLVQELYKNDPRKTTPIDATQFLSDRTLEANLVSRWYQCTQLEIFYTRLLESTNNLISLIDNELEHWPVLKLFRNIRKSLLNEGKTGKYLKYALGEIVLVVIGILIALQINNANERSKSNEMVELYKKNIVTELKADLEEINRLDSIIKVHKKSIQDYVDYYEQDELDIEILHQKIDSAQLTLATFNTSTYTIQDLFTTGNLKLFSTPLKNAILEYKNKQDQRIEVQLKITDFQITKFNEFEKHIDALYTNGFSNKEHAEVKGWANNVDSPQFRMQNNYVAGFFEYYNYQLASLENAKKNATQLLETLQTP